MERVLSRTNLLEVEDDVPNAAADWAARRMLSQSLPPSLFSSVVHHHITIVPVDEALDQSAHFAQARELFDAPIPAANDEAHLTHLWTAGETKPIEEYLQAQADTQAEAAEAEAAEAEAAEAAGSNSNHE